MAKCLLGTFEGRLSSRRRKSGSAKGCRIPKLPRRPRTKVQQSESRRVFVQSPINVGNIFCPVTTFKEQSVTFNVRGDLRKKTSEPLEPTYAISTTPTGSHLVSQSPDSISCIVPLNSSVQRHKYVKNQCHLLSNHRNITLNASNENSMGRTGNVDNQTIM